MSCGQTPKLDRARLAVRFLHSEERISDTMRDQGLAFIEAHPELLNSATFKTIDLMDRNLVFQWVDPHPADPKRQRSVSILFNEGTPLLEVITSTGAQLTGTFDITDTQQLKEEVRKLREA